MGIKTKRLSLEKSAKINKKIIAALNKDQHYDRRLLAKQCKITMPQLYGRIHDLRRRGELPQLDSVVEVTGAPPVVDLSGKAPVVQLPAVKSVPANKKITKYVAKRSSLTCYTELVDSLIRMEPAQLTTVVQVLDQLDNIGDEKLTERALETARALANR